ncbi:MAG: tetratricopeptide repeat protein, partial [Nitrospinota bacterium]
MLKPRKRLTKQQIKEDKFVTYYFKAQDFISQNSRYVTWGLIGIPVVIFASFIFSNIRQEKDKSANIELSKARIDYFAENYESAMSTLNNLTENYGGTQAGKKGLYYLANAHFMSKNFDEAEQYFGQFLDQSSDKDLTVSALAGIAACQEEKGDFSIAA